MTMTTASFLSFRRRYFVHLPLTVLFLAAFAYQLSTPLGVLYGYLGLPPFFNNKKRNNAKLTVIGAGFPRSGTKSTQRALELLGHKIYDTVNIVQHHHQERWIEAARAWKDRGDLGPTEQLVQDMEDQGYTATLDTPMNLFALPFAKIRPEAKVLMTVRDNEEVWMDSYAAINRIGAPLFRGCRPWRWIFPSFRYLSELQKILINVYLKDMQYPNGISRLLPWYEMVVTHPMETPHARQLWIEAHKKFQKELEESIPADRLLVFNVKQGWKPLIAFLGIEDGTDIMEQPFPHVNDRISLRVLRAVLEVLVLFLPVWPLVFFLWLARSLYCSVF